ncbi:MAG: twin-arginine translocation signal domain-containing protein, partial [Desulfovibrio sp.]|nr:twin-arginine translocation signal domain-containing protein [Desulfovibrio sp.]
MTLSRREFLKGSAAAIALSAVSGPAFAALAKDTVDTWVKGV